MGLATLKFQLDVVSNDGETTVAVNRTVRWAPAIDGGERDEVTLAAGFTALSPPTGAKAVVIIPDDAAVSLTLKGVTGDGGTTIAPASSPINGPSFLWLGDSPSIGILNAGATTTAVVHWL